MKIAFYCTFVCLCFLKSIDTAFPADFNTARPVSMASLVYELYQKSLSSPATVSMKRVDFRYEKYIPYTLML